MPLTEPDYVILAGVRVRCSSKMLSRDVRQPGLRLPPKDHRRLAGSGLAFYLATQMWVQVLSLLSSDVTTD